MIGSSNLSVNAEERNFVAVVVIEIIWHVLLPQRQGIMHLIVVSLWAGVVFLTKALELSNPTDFC